MCKVVRILRIFKKYFTILNPLKSSFIHLAPCPQLPSFSDCITFLFLWSVMFVHILVCHCEFSTGLCCDKSSMVIAQILSEILTCHGPQILFQVTKSTFQGDDSFSRMIAFLKQGVTISFRGLFGTLSNIYYKLSFIFSS